MLTTWKERPKSAGLGAPEARKEIAEKVESKPRQRNDCKKKKTRDQAFFPSHAHPSPSPLAFTFQLTKANRARTVSVRAEERTVVIGLAADSGASKIDQEKEKKFKLEGELPTTKHWALSRSLSPSSPDSRSHLSLLPLPFLLQNPSQAAANPPSCAA